MSLSARIAVRASRRLELLAHAVASGGLGVAAFTAASRWPDRAWLTTTVAVATIVVIAWSRRSGITAGHVLTVSDRAEIAVSPAAESDDRASGDIESWRLDDSTMVWPGFSVIGLRRKSDAGHRGRSMRLAMFDTEMGAIDRRALHRYLLWSLRGGQGSRAPLRTLDETPR